MYNISLSKSRYCRARQCNKMLWMDINKKEEAIDKASKEVLENGTKVGELARRYFGDFVNIEYNKELSKMLIETEECLKNVPNIITEASFNYDNNFCSVDILKNDIDGLEIYEVKSSTEVKDIYLDDISYQVYILKNLGYKVKKANIMYINNKYIRKGDLDLKQLFTIKDVTDIAISKQDEVKKKIAEINKYMKTKYEPEEEISMKCFEPYVCNYWEYCTRNLPKKNVFSIARMNKKDKLDLYYKGKYSYEELIKENLGWKFHQQIEVDLTNEAVIDKEQIKEFIKNITYPLYFLDFETYMSPIPEYDNSFPFEKIPFQYSLHYIKKEGGKLEHKEYLAKAGIDPRREIAERLVKDIPKDVCITAYNMSFEKERIKELANQFEDLKEHLLNIHDNIIDLMIPFSKRWYYTKQMQGSYSIKYVLPALFPNDPELDYHKLPIVHNGEEAMNIFANLKKYSKEEQEKIRYGLLKYCELDTYAMVKIWEKLNEIIKK